MAWKPTYATLAELKHALSPGIADTVDDAELTRALGAASRAIDHHCGRQFGLEDEVSVRYYTPTSHGRAAVVIDDLMVTDDLVVKVGAPGTYDTTLELDVDFALFPWNAEVDGRPWTMLVGMNGAALPCRDRSVQVSATFGWSAVPTEVVQACLLQASRIFKRKDSPFGVAGSPEMGSEVRLLSKVDPDVAVLLSGVRRYFGAV